MYIFPDGATECKLEEEPYKEESLKKFEAWPEDLKAKDVAKMSMVYLHTGHISRDPKSRRGTLTVKPMEVTIVNLSKKTTLHLGASFFKSGRFSNQPTGAIGIGESHTYSISSKDGRANKTGVKGGLAFIVYDVEEDVEEEKQDEENGEKKKKKKEKKEKKKKEKKEKKEKKKRKKEEEAEGDNKEAEDGEKNEEEQGEDEADGEEKPAEENAEGEGGEEENADEEKKDDGSNVGEEQEHKADDEEDLPEGNGDFFICAFENPLAGTTKAKCNKTDSKDIAPLLKQLKNDHKPIEQEMFGHYKDGKRHFVFVWKDDDLEW